MKKNTFLLFILVSISIFGQDKLTSSVDEFYNGSSWTSNSRTEYEYDNSNNLIEELELSWDFVTSSWKDNYKTIYTYNIAGKTITEVYQEFDSSTNAFLNLDRTKNSYNANGDLSQILVEYWNGSSYVFVFKFELIYTNNILTSGIGYSWDGSDWALDDDSTNILINYNADNTISSSVSGEWNGTGWDSISRTLLSYDASKRLIEQESEEYDGTNWTVDYTEQYTYDSNNNVVLLKESFLDNGILVSLPDVTVSFDTNALMSSFAHPFKDKTGIDYLFSVSGIVNKILNRTSTNSRTTFNYGEPTASLNDFNSISFSVYPNPTNSIVNIDDSLFSLKNVEIYNIIGKKIMTSTSNKINLKSLTNGIYVLKVEDKNGNSATKRIVKK